jgi:membrane dipeptidase
MLLATLAAFPFPQGDETLRDRAAEIHRSAIVVDTHSDVTPKFEDPEYDFSVRHEDGHMDLPRMVEGGLDVQFLSIYMGKVEGPGTGPGTAVQRSLRRIDAAWRMTRRHADRAEMALTAVDVRRIVAAGKIAFLMGMEGGHMIEDDLAVLRMYHRLGVRYLTLTHSFHTNWADSAGIGEPIEPSHGGLTDLGREIIREMNRLGMIVDLSHVSEETFADAIETTVAPPIASHSSCRALHDHPRNLKDEQLRALASKGGVVQINFFSGFIDPAYRQASERRRAELAPQVDKLRERFGEDEEGFRRARRELFREHPLPKTPLSVLIDHIDHAIRVAGPDHVGLGADWDGVEALPEGMEDCSRLPSITFELLRRGHSEETIRKVLGENTLRVLARCEEVARELGGA